MSLEDALDRAESVLASRREKPLLLQLNPQGFVERSARLTLGITDTGGQNLYVEEMSAELARQGYRVMIVNRAGPSIMEYMGQLAAEAGDVPELEMERWKHRNDLRIGMHYCADGVDVLYIDDGFRVDEKRVFVAKEDMYDHEEFDPEQPSGPPRRRTHFRKLAEDLFQHTHDEPIVKVFSHYADGGAVGRLFKRIRNKAGLPEIPHIHIPHSTGHLKEAKFVSSGTSTEGLRLPARKQTEQAFSEIRILLTTRDINNQEWSHRII